VPPTWDERLLTALKVGISHAEFWDLTPGEVSLSLEAYRWNHEQNLRAQISAAYSNAAFQGGNKYDDVLRMWGLKAAVKKVAAPDQVHSVMGNAMRHQRIASKQ
jgi:hypothetical protein